MSPAVYLTKSFLGRFTTLLFFSISFIAICCPSQATLNKWYMHCAAVAAAAAALDADDAAALDADAAA